MNRLKRLVILCGQTLGVLMLCSLALAFISGALFMAGGNTYAAQKVEEHRWWYVTARWEEINKYYTIGPMPTKEICQEALSAWMVSNVEAAKSSLYYERWWRSGPSSIQCVCARPGIRYQEVEPFMEELRPHEDCQLE